MRMLLLSVLIGTGLIIGGVSLFAPWKQQTKQIAAIDITADITGEITAISGDLLSVKDEAGITHFIMVTYPKALEGLKVRDNVNMKIERGAVVSIEKAESEPAEPVSEAKSTKLWKGDELKYSPLFISPSVVSVKFYSYTV